MKFKGKKSIMAAALSTIVAANSFSMVALAEQPAKKLFVGCASVGQIYPNGECPDGRVVISNYYPEAGEEIIVTVTPDAGCKIGSFSLYYNQGNGECFFHDSDITGTYEKRFIMPSVNVQVGVRFDFINPPTSKPDPTPTPTPDPTPTPTPTPDPTPTLSWKKGDANCDGKVTAADATAILKHLTGIMELSYVGSVNADMDQNGKVTAADATAILKMLVGKS